MGNIEKVAKYRSLLRNVISGLYCNGDIATSDKGKYDNEINSIKTIVDVISTLKAFLSITKMDTIEYLQLQKISIELINSGYAI